MEPRYSAPSAEHLFSPQTKIDLWTEFTRRYAIMEWTDRHPNAAFPLSGELAGLPLRVPVKEATEAEDIYGHEVVAFIHAFISRSPIKWWSYIHYGLTSSDLVDNALMSQLRMHSNEVETLARTLRSKVRDLAFATTGPRPGRTHGQLAEITSFGHQLHVWVGTLDAILTDLDTVHKRTIATKTPGPTGHSPLRGDHLPNPVASTQVIPRDVVLQWATVYARLATHLENLALQVRLGGRMSPPEIMEGGASDRTGSSAMPHKKNPIDCEKVTGLARLVRGHMSSLAESVALWDDRDLTQSSVERVAVPEIAQFVEHSVITMIKVVENLVINKDVMAANADRDECYSSIWQGLIMKHARMSCLEASAILRSLMEKDDKPLIDKIKTLFSDDSSIEAMVVEFESIKTQVTK
jgi:adenylosuccinate lyase